MHRKIQQIQRLLASTGYHHENEDCSEVAERVISILGEGIPITFVRLRPDGYFMNMAICDEYAHETWKYHVVVSLNYIIIDLSTKQRVWVGDEYKKALIAANTDGYTKIFYTYRDISNIVLGKYRLDVNDLIKLELKTLGL